MGVVYDMLEAARILSMVRTIAVVGASRNPAKDAYRVPEYLVRAGYEVIPVNPSADKILGRKAYPSLLDIPDDIASRIDVIDVFRPPEEALTIVEQAIEMKRRYGRPHIIWFQPGTSSPEALESAVREGFTVVRGLCIKVVHATMTR